MFLDQFDLAPTYLPRVALSLTAKNARSIRVGASWIQQKQMSRSTKNELVRLCGCRTLVVASLMAWSPRVMCQTAESVALSSTITDATGAVVSNATMGWLSRT